MNKVDVKLIEFESMLHASVQRVGRAVSNLHQEMGGFASKTPGSGDPGGGKGGRPTVSIPDPTDPVTHQQLEQDAFEGAGRKRKLVRRGRQVVTSVVEDGSFAVPVTSVEVRALGFAGRDVAERKLTELRRSAIDMVHGFGAACTSAGVDPGPFDSASGTSRIVALGYARVRRLQRAGVSDEGSVQGWLKILDPKVESVFHICQNWGYVPGTPSVPKARAELLAVDLTELWCTSHLRVGDKRERSRGELCDWCYRHGPLLVATWDAPPLDLVRLHVDHGKVYAHQVEPFLKAERDRQRNRVKV